MAHAFVIEWDPSHYNLPIVVDADYGYDLFCGPREKRNECNFTLQNTVVIIQRPARLMQKFCVV